MPTKKKTRFKKFTFSTYWNGQDKDDGELMLKEIYDLGFDQVELHHLCNERNLRGIEEFLKKGKLKVSGIHNACLSPDNVEMNGEGAGVFSLSSIDEAERQRAVASSKQSLRLAKELGGQYVVLHLGWIDIQEFMIDLLELAREGKQDTPQYQKLKEGLFEERDNFAREYFDAAAESLSELSKDALQLDIALGLKNRFYLREVPCLEEMEVLLRYFRRANVGYWHDVGNAFVQESLGLYRMGSHIESFHREMIGTNLHDVKHFESHRVPYFGEIDFFVFESFLQDKTIKAIEVSPQQKAEDIVSGVSKLDKIF